MYKLCSNSYMSKFCLTPPSQRFELPQPDAFTTKASQLVGEGRNLVALGAPGSGKTTLAVSLVAQAVAQGRQAVLLSPTRVRADQLRTYLVQAQTQLASRQGQAASQSPQTQPSPAQTGPTADSGVPADKSGPAQVSPNLYPGCCGGRPGGVGAGGHPARVYPGGFCAAHPKPVV